MKCSRRYKALGNDFLSMAADTQDALIARRALLSLIKMDILAGQDRALCAASQASSCRPLLYLKGAADVESLVQLIIITYTL